MKKIYYKKIFGFLLIILLLFNSIPIISTASEKVENKCIHVEKFEYTEDYDELLEMSLQNYKFRSIGSEALEIVQIVEERVYSDGTIEKDYIKTTFPQINGIQPRDIEKYKETAAMQYGVYATIRANYTVKIDGITKPLVSLRNVVVTIQNIWTTVNASRGIIYSSIENNVTSTGVTCQPHFNSQSYTHTVNSSFIVPTGQIPGDGNMFFYSNIYTIDGKDFQILQQITVDDY